MSKFVLVDCSCYHNTAKSNSANNAEHQASFRVRSGESRGWRTRDLTRLGENVPFCIPPASLLPFVRENWLYCSLITLESCYFLN